VYSEKPDKSGISYVVVVLAHPWSNAVFVLFCGNSPAPSTPPHLPCFPSIPWFIIQFALANVRLRQDCVAPVGARRSRRFTARSGKNAPKLASPNSFER